MSTETTVVIAGWLIFATGLLVTMFGLSYVLARVGYEIRWYMGRSRQMKLHAKLGWNTGEPPDGSTFIAAEYAKQLHREPGYLSWHGWAIMTRRGDTLHTINGGMTMPVNCVTGWIAVSIPEDESP